MANNPIMVPMTVASDSEAIPMSAGTDTEIFAMSVGVSIGGGGSGLTEDIKSALLDCFEHVAWIDEDGQEYYDALYNALYPPADLVSISAVYTQSGVVYPTDSLDSLKPDLVVTAHYSDSSTATVTTYTLSGTLAAGTSTITVTYSGKTTTFNVTVTAAPVLDSITAVYTQSGTVYDTDSLDSLKTDLVVTAHYSDTTTSTVASSDYTLSGTLTTGTSTVTVGYGGFTTTFSVTVTHNEDADWDYIWRYTDGLPDASEWTWTTSGGSSQVREIISDGMLMAAKSGNQGTYTLNNSGSAFSTAGGGVAEFEFYVPNYAFSGVTKVHLFEFSYGSGSKGLRLALVRNAGGAKNICLVDSSDWYGGTLVGTWDYETPTVLRLEFDNLTEIGKAYINGTLAKDNINITTMTSEVSNVRLYAGGTTVNNNAAGVVVKSVKVKYGSPNAS